jgi:hypothetical protein
MIYRTPNNPHPRDSSDNVDDWKIQWKIFNRIRTLVNWILKIINFLHTRIHEQGAAGFACSPTCCCVGATATTGLIVVGAGLGVGLGIGIKYDGENLNSTFFEQNNGSTIGNATRTLLQILKIRVW